MCQTHVGIGREYLKPLETRNPDFEKRIRESFACQPFMVTIGASLSRIEPGRVDISVPFADHITQQHGLSIAVWSGRLPTMPLGTPHIR